MKYYSVNYVVALVLILQIGWVEVKEGHNPFVIPQKAARGVSAATLRQDVGSLVADIIELSTVLSETLCRIQKSSMAHLRAWLSDDDSFLSRASKTELSCKRDHLNKLKTRYKKLYTEMKEIEDELIRSLEATCV